MKVEFETYWVGGHGGPQRAIDLAHAAAEAIHTLNYATMPNADGLVYPSNVGSVLSGLQSAVSHMHQLLNQMAKFAEKLAQDANLYHDQNGDAQVTALGAAIELRAAADRATILRDAMSRAYTPINHLGIREDEDQAEINGGPDDWNTHFSASGVPR